MEPRDRVRKKLSFSCRTPVGSGKIRLLTFLSVTCLAKGAPTSLLDIVDDCAVTLGLEDNPIICNEGHDLYRYTLLDRTWNSGSSCSSCSCNAYQKGCVGPDETGATCNEQLEDDVTNPQHQKYNIGPQCCPGWNGTLCDLCSTVEVCPRIASNASSSINGTIAAHTCTSGSIVPYSAEEAAVGKKYSCTCGGGGDPLSANHCGDQGLYKNLDGSDSDVPVTRFDWTFFGLGTEDSPGTIELAMNVGIHGKSWETVSGELDYQYPLVWAGTLDRCIITEGKCTPVKGTDVDKEDCYNFDCKGTQISCPPEGWEPCPGGTDNCDYVPTDDDTVEPKKYQTNQCQVTPTNGEAFSINCLKERNPDGSTVCFYNQGSSGYSGMSMTCSTGTCLYNSSGNFTSEYAETVIRSPGEIQWQFIALVIVTSAVVGSAVVLEVTRRCWEHRQTCAFEKRKQIRQKYHLAVAAPTAAADSSIPANGEEVASSPLHAPLPKASLSAAQRGSTSSSSASAPASLQAPLLEHGEGTGGALRPPDRQTASSLSWSNIQLWVPATPTEQLAVLSRRFMQEQQRDSESAGESVARIRGPGAAAEETPAPAVDGTRGAAIATPLRQSPEEQKEQSLEKPILRSVSGRAERGGVTALMGPSGAGKTSLLDCLAARKPMHRVTGAVRVDGELCTRVRMRAVSGYVAQHDVLPGVLTVREHLLFHARLRCPASGTASAGTSRLRSDVDRRMRVEEVISSLQLLKCADTIIGGEFKRGLSGGEKRRVSVAEELLVEPGILFLDEPTTGLDSATAMSICRTLTGIAARGTTVLLSIHQPREDIFNLFDRVLVLCEGGRVVFEGSGAAVPIFLQRSVDMAFLSLPGYASKDASDVRFSDGDCGGMAAGDMRGSDGGAGSGGGRSVASTNDPARRGKNHRSKAGGERRLNPADLLLDLASCPQVQEIADEVAEGSFDDIMLRGGGDGENDGQDRGGCEAAQESNTTVGGRLCEGGVYAFLLRCLISAGFLIDISGEEEEEEEEEEDKYGDDFYDDEIEGGSATRPKRARRRKQRTRYTASALVQVLVLSERLVLTATRHPMLLTLQYGGAIFLAVAVGFIFRDLDDDLYGVQDRFGVLFFLPFCLILLGMSSLPVWRDEHVLFTHEQGNKRIYGFPAYFLSVLFFDLVLVRTIPPLFFALISYKLIGLNDACDKCLLYFAMILVLTNIISALIAMTVGAFRFSTAFSNLIGALLALMFALFSGFLVSKKAMKHGLPVFLADPMAYSFEALLINQFGDQKDKDGNYYIYTINGSWCAHGLDVVYPTGNTLLSTFGFASSQEKMQEDIYALWTGALWCVVISFGVLVLSSEAPKVNAAIKRVCQISPLGLCKAMIRILLCGAVQSRRIEGGDAEENRLRLATGDSHRSGGSIESMHEFMDRGASNVFDADRPRGHSAVGADGTIITEEDDADEQCDSTDEANDAGENYAANERLESAITPPATHVTGAGFSSDGAGRSDSGTGGSQHLLRLLRAQLQRPADERFLSSPMVLSFHNVRLSVPRESNAAIRAAKALLNVQNDVPEKSPLGASSGVSASTTKFIVTLDTYEALGMNVARGVVSGAAVVRCIAPNSWAHRSKILPGDVLVRILPMSPTSTCRPDENYSSVDPSRAEEPLVPPSSSSSSSSPPSSSASGVFSLGTYDDLSRTIASSGRPLQFEFSRCVDPRERARQQRREREQGRSNLLADCCQSVLAVATIINESAGHMFQAGNGNSNSGNGQNSESATVRTNRRIGMRTFRRKPTHEDPNRKPILRGVSGSSLSAVPAMRRRALDVDSPTPLDSTPPAPSLSSPVKVPPMMMAIMGPSGAGKTSLLDCLAGRKTVGLVTGSVCLNGRSMQPNEMRLLSGYVVQDDVLPGTLSVVEYLTFQSMLRVPLTEESEHSGAGGGDAAGADGQNRSARTQRVNEVLKKLKLVRCANTLIGSAFRRGISGGEKRRVSTAVELLSRPAVLFLDEPTTGQDSATAVKLCKALRRISREGTTVVMSIHQPRIDIFEMMTQIVFLTKDGRVAYCGPSRGLRAYLTGVSTAAAPSASPSRARPGGGASSNSPSNPADDFLDVMSVVEPERLVHKYGASPAGALQSNLLILLSNSETNPDNRSSSGRARGSDEGRQASFLFEILLKARGKHRATWSSQFFVLSQRALRNTLRNPFPFFLHGVTAVATAVTLGVVFSDIHARDDETAGTQDRMGIMFFIILYLSLLSLTSLPLWRDEQQLFIAERGSGIYGTSPYVLASICFDLLPYRLLPPTAFTLIAYPVIQLNNAHGAQLQFFTILVVMNVATSGLCMLVGVLTPDNASANAAGSLCMLSSILFCGYLLNKTSMPGVLDWLQQWAPGNYAYEALVVNEMKGLDELYITSTIGKATQKAGPFTGLELAHCFGFEDQITYDVVVLAIMACGYLAVMLVVMKLYVKEKR